jgi:hypothetical protein
MEAVANVLNWAVLIVGSCALPFLILLFWWRKRAATGEQRPIERGEFLSLLIPVLIIPVVLTSAVMNEVMRQKRMPRKLTARADTLLPLKNLAATKSIIVSYPNGLVEPADYAAEWKRMLIEAGWTVETRALYVFSDRPVVGIWIVIREHTPESQAMIEFLRQNGIPFNVELGNNSNNNRLEIFIGEKPA